MSATKPGGPSAGSIRAPRDRRRRPDRPPRGDAECSRDHHASLFCSQRPGSGAQDHSALTPELKGPRPSRDLRCQDEEHEQRGRRQERQVAQPEVEGDGHCRGEGDQCPADDDPAHSGSKPGIGVGYPKPGRGCGRDFVQIWTGVRHTQMKLRPPRSDAFSPSGRRAPWRQSGPAQPSVRAAGRGPRAAGAGQAQLLPAAMRLGERSQPTQAPSTTTRTSAWISWTFAGDRSGPEFPGLQTGSSSGAARSRAP